MICMTAHVQPSRIPWDWSAWYEVMPLAEEQAIVAVSASAHRPVDGEFQIGIGHCAAEEVIAHGLTRLDGSQLTFTVPFDVEGRVAVRIRKAGRDVTPVDVNVVLEEMIESVSSCEYCGSGVRGERCDSCGAPRRIRRSHGIR